MNGRAVKPTVVVSSARASHKALGSTCNIYVIPFNVAPHPPADYVEGISRALKITLAPTTPLSASSLPLTLAWWLVDNNAIFKIV